VDPPRHNGTGIERTGRLDNPRPCLDPFVEMNNPLVLSGLIRTVIRNWKALLVVERE